jgi:hypothetical protein
MLQQNNNSIKDDAVDSFDRQRDKSRFELDEVQEHFLWSNEMLVDGIPYSKWLKIQEMKRKQNETK